MQSFGLNQAEKELNDPTSPYYLGKPTVPEQIRGFLNGTGRCNMAGYYNTNYFGADAPRYLAQPKADILEINRNARKSHDINFFWKTLGVSTASLITILLLRKIPFSGQILNIAGSGLKLLGKGIGYMFKGIGWLFKK